MDTNFSLADMAAACGGNNCNNQWNNPMWLIWAILFGNGGLGFGNRAGAGVEVNDRLNSLQAQIANNQNTNALGGAIGANHEQLHGLNAAINAASTANLLSQKDMTAQMASCCCDIKSNILNQTNQLQSQIAQLANGVQTGFANIGFLTQQQTNELNTTANANTQRILDKMCNDTTQNLRDKLWEASQQAQTASIVSQLKTTS